MRPVQAAMIAVLLAACSNETTPVPVVVAEPDAAVAPKACSTPGECPACSRPDDCGEGSVCVVAVEGGKFCAGRCEGHEQCSSGCCLPLDDTGRSACSAASFCGR